MLTLIQAGVLIAGSTIGAITDAKTGYIYDWVTYPMIGIGFLLAIAQQQWNNVIIGAGLFVLLYIAYKFGKLGGGDVKLFVGIALLNPNNDYYFLATVMLFAAMSAMVFFSIYFFIKYYKKGITYKENKKGITKATLFGVIIVGYFAFMMNAGYITQSSAALIATPLMFGLVFIALQKGITKNFFEKKILINQIEEDEVIAEERNTKKALALLKGKRLVGIAEAKLLKKNGVKEIYVLRGLPPFGPFILIGVLGALIAPEFFIYLFMR